MMKIIFFIFAAFFVVSCGVKLPPTPVLSGVAPRFSREDNSAKPTPTPTPTPTVLPTVMPPAAESPQAK